MSICRGMSEAELHGASASGTGSKAAARDLAAELAEARAEIERLRSEYDDLQLLYEATIEHGEAVEDQLAESNILLQATQARLEAELADASRYVMSIIPEPRAADPRVDWRLVSSTELGGDSFGYHDIDEDHFAIYLLDVCGHGVGAALLSVTVINVLRASALPGADFRDPPAVLAALNDAFPMERQNDMFFTIWYGVYQRSTGKLFYSTAGHPPAIHLRRQGRGTRGATLLAGDGGMAIGAFAGMQYDLNVAGIEPGDRLLVLSDGTYEVGEGSDMLSLQALVEFVRAGGNDRPSAVLDWVRSYGGSDSLPDDFSLLRIRF
jgi:sigma-B regulation protein RsbU (phosphoserine phosphatase)